MACALRISESASLALHAMGVVAAHPDQPLTASSIADRLRAAEGTVAKALQRLVKSGLLHSLRGPRGGFCLAGDPAKVTLLDVYESVEGPFSPSDCLLSEPLCQDGDCLMGTLIRDINQMLYDRFRSTTLADVTKIFHTDRFRIEPR